MSELDLDAIIRPLVFTNGCFDILHLGHVRYLEQASTLGATLMVAVNSDASVRALKGSSRPINSEADRMAMLRALWCVDHVVLFDATTPEELIKRVRPDVYVKGGDYDVPSIPEGRIVTAYGGLVVTLPFVAGYSTSRIAERIRAEQI